MSTAPEAAENLIKLHKGQLASDRCQSPLANQLRLVLHTGAYWLLALRDAIPRAAPLARAEFATLRLRLLIGVVKRGTLTPCWG